MSDPKLTLPAPKDSLLLASGMRSARPKGRLLLAILLAVVILTSVGMFMTDRSELIGGLAVVNMLALLFLRVPLAFSLLAPSLLAMWALRGTRLVVGTMMTMPYSEIASWSLSVLPMFILMGMLIASTGIGADIYRVAALWFPRVPASFGVASTVAGTGLAAVSGSSIGTAYALSRVAIPEMLRAGYDRRFAMASVMAAGLPGQLIPPSILLIIFAGVAETPIGPQLLTGVGPGLLVAVVFIVATIIAGLVFPTLVGKTAESRTEPRAATDWKARWQALGRAWPLPVLMLVVIGGMFSGFFTATEAGACAALVALIVAAMRFRKARTFAPILDGIVSTVATTGAIFFLLVGATALAQMLVLTGIGRFFIDTVKSFGLSAVGFLLLMALVYLIMGMFMETLPMMLLTVPIVLPILELLEISPLWFGVFITLMGELAMLTPPVGILLYVMHGITRDPTVNQGQSISLRDAIVAVCWVIPIGLVVVVLLILFPEIATFIPDNMFQR